MDTNASFLGRGWGFPPEFNKISSSVRMIAGKDDIDESLRILMATVPLERVMQPAFGCGLKALVFESINETTITLIKDAVQRAVLFFEPRINLESVQVDAAHEADGLLQITLEYTVRTTNNRSNLVYPFYFQEGTNIST